MHSNVFNLNLGSLMGSEALLTLKTYCTRFEQEILYLVGIDKSFNMFDLEQEFLKSVTSKILCWEFLSTTVQNPIRY